MNQRDFQRADRPQGESSHTVESLLPISISRSGWLMWLISLSLFFVALIARCFNLRFAAMQSTVGESIWPASIDLHHPMAWVVTSLLLLALVFVCTLIAARLFARGSLHAAKALIGLSLLLGIGWGLLRWQEYRDRSDYRLVSSRFHNRIHDRADLSYASDLLQRWNALHQLQRLQESRQNVLEQKLRNETKLQSSEAAELAELQQSAPLRKKQLQESLQLMESTVGWTTDQIATSAITPAQKKMLVELAYCVFPLSQFASIAKEEESRQLQLLDQRHQVLQANRERDRDEMSKLYREFGDVKKSHDEVVANDETAKRESQQRLDLAAQKIVEFELNNREQENELKKVDQRLTVLRLAESETDRKGLVGSHPWLHLPIALPGGHRWSLSYYVLTSFATLVMAVGWIATFRCFFIRDPDHRLDSVRSVAWYQLLVLALWLALFPFLYWS